MKDTVSANGPRANRLSLRRPTIQVPSPLNLWMNIPWTEDPKPCGSLGVIPPVSKPGDYIVMRAEMDCIIAFSACPQVAFKHLSAKVIV